jgi:predicted dehydrogenase
MPIVPKKELQLAVVGCGAMAEHQHLRLLSRRSDCRVVALVDRDETRLKRLADKYGVPHALTDYRGLAQVGIDAAIVALPNHLHMPVCCELLAGGIHVLVEKPMALSVAECEAMMDAARSGGLVLAVGLIRRYSHASIYARWAIGSGLLGPVTGFDIQSGLVYSWPIASDFFVRKDMGGGVLLDLGSHMLDQLLWWLGDVASVEYYDDSEGGVEADCLIRLTMQCGAKGSVQLSWIRELTNKATIHGERASLEVSLTNNAVLLRSADGSVALSGHAAQGPMAVFGEQRASDMVIAEHNDFLQAIRTGRPLQVGGAEARACAALIESCRAKRQPLVEPWRESPSVIMKEEVA